MSANKDRRRIDRRQLEPGEDWAWGKIEPRERLMRARTGSVFWPTNENWYGTYEGGFCRVHVVDWGAGQFKIVVAGNDDTSMEIEIDGAERLQSVYRRIPLPVDFGSLRSLGFQFC